jgi:hypothetical protein
MTDTPHEMTARHSLLNEACAIRLVLALFASHEPTDDDYYLHAWRSAFDEIDCRECLEEVTTVLATMLAERMAPPEGPEQQRNDAERELNEQLVRVLDLAAQEKQ